MSISLPKIVQERKDGITIHKQVWIGGISYPFLMQNFLRKFCRMITPSEYAYYWTNPQGHRVALSCNEIGKINYGMTIYFDSRNPVGILTMTYDPEIKNYHYVVTRVKNNKPVCQVEIIGRISINRKKITSYKNPFSTHLCPHGVKFIRGGTELALLEPLDMRVVYDKT